jgi:hypothetical protein
MNTNVRLDPDGFVLRLGLMSASVVLFNVGLTFWASGQPLVYPISLWLSFIVWACGAVVGILAFTTHLNRRWTWVILAAFLMMLVQTGCIESLRYTPLSVSRTDNEMIAKFAVEALKKGQNPYTWNFSDITRVYRAQDINLTPFLDGSYQYRLTYPALPTLALLALDAIGIDQPRVLGFIFYIVLVCLIFLSAPPRIRPVILLPVFLLKDITPAIMNGTLDVVWSVLLIGVILTWKRPVLSAILFGLACAFRQQPWFVAPFLLIYLWNQPENIGERWHRVARFVGISVGVFLVINLPFILWDFRAWMLGAFEPSYALFNVYSHGLGALSQFGITTLPREFFTILQVSFLILALFIHWRHPRMIGQAFWIFPAIFFWFYYRGLANYWIFWLPPLLVASIRWLDFHQPSIRPVHRQWKLTAIVATAILLNLILGVFILSREPLISVQYTLPLETNLGGTSVNQLRLRVANRSSQIFEPRFSAQRDPGIQALPWIILSGPDRLGPGESAEYVVSANNLPLKSIPLDRGGQIVVSDAGGNYSLRTVLSLPTGMNDNEPDLIANRDFRFWTQNGFNSAPVNWTLNIREGVNTLLSLQEIEGRSALKVETNRVAGVDPQFATRVTQYITFPYNFDIWVYPTSHSTNPREVVYGVELDDGEHQLWVLFGDTDESGSLESKNQRYIFVRSALNTWSKHHIDVEGMYHRFEWQFPEFSIRENSGLRYPARQVKFSLITNAANSVNATWFFGAIEQDSRYVGPSTAVEEAIKYPDQYYVNLGDQYRLQKNFELAQNAYLKAQIYNKSNAESYAGLGLTKLGTQDHNGAIEAFQTALKLGFRRPGHMHQRIGQAQYESGNYVEARKAFQEAARFAENTTLYSNTDRGVILNGLGWTLLQGRQCDEAIAYFEAASLYNLTSWGEFPGPRRGIEQCQSLNSGTR